jgi:hypothetical protein
VDGFFLGDILVGSVDTEAVPPSGGSDACGGVIFSPSSWEPQEEGMMNIAARFSLSKKPRYVDQERKEPND